MQIMLNEIHEAERILKSGEVGKKPSSTLFLLGKYYRQKEELDKVETNKKLNEFMENNYKNYNSVLWENTIEDISKKAIKYPLTEIQYVGITTNELLHITNISNEKYQRLLFTMLCYAKFHNIKSENNNGWVNADIPEIFRVARVTVKYKKDKFLHINDLEQSGLISFSNKNDNLNIKVNFIDVDGLLALKISDFRELGYEYMNYIGNGNFIRCSECGRLVRKSGQNTKYCRKCSDKKRLETKRDWWNANN